MPLTVKKIGKKYRVIEKNTGKPAKNAAGTALDGGGHSSKAQAESQISGISISKARKAGHRIPMKGAKFT